MKLTAKTKKRILIIVAAVLVAVALATSLGIYFDWFYVADKEGKSARFRESLEQCGYANSFDNAYVATEVYGEMYKHFTANASGKKPKLLFIGFDGFLATGIGQRKGAPDSGIALLKETGGAYLTRTGGATIGDQVTKTAPGWATLLTGTWGAENGVTGNGSVLNESTRSIVYTLGEAGYKTSFHVSWASHIKKTYKKEVASASQKGLPIEYTLNSDDYGTFDGMMRSIVRGDDAIFGILEYTDHAGHSYGYDLGVEEYARAVHEADRDAYCLIQAVFQRASCDAEDWLIVIASDHGGANKQHGNTTVMEYTTIFISNKTPSFAG